MQKGKHNFTLREKTPIQIKTPCKNAGNYQKTIWKTANRQPHTALNNIPPNMA